jgi:hypothetical protein
MSTILNLQIRLHLLVNAASSDVQQIRATEIILLGFQISAKWVPVTDPAKEARLNHSF